MSVANPVVLSWNGPERRIYLKQGITAFHWIDDIYKEYRNERRLNEDFRKYNAFVIASGNEAKGGGKATPRLLKLLEDVKVICWDENIEITVGGEAITDNADIDPILYDNSTRTQPLIINYQPPAAEIIVVDSIAQGLDYAGVLVYDGILGVAGEDYPVGTSASPVNNQADGQIIAEKYSLKVVDLESDFMLSSDINNFSIRGATPNVLFVANGYKADVCRIYDLIVSGNFNTSHVDFFRCELSDAYNIDGVWRDCIFDGAISVVANNTRTVQIINCNSGIPGTATPTLNCNGDGANISMRGYKGGIKFTNKTGSSNISLDFISGQCILASTVTNGKIVVRGDGKLVDEAGDVIPTGTWNGADILNETNSYLTSISGGGGGIATVDEEVIHDSLDSYENKDDYKATTLIDAAAAEEAKKNKVYYFRK